ncbi:MAG TPA: pilin [Candidatus Moranbacteria bacterium]|nr:pilin [Candidatus Moranbacteria bacterium]
MKRILFYAGFIISAALVSCIGAASEAKADACSDAHPGFVCKDAALVQESSSCYANICANGRDGLCCPASVSTGKTGTQGGSSAACGPGEICFGNPIKVSSVEGLLGNFLGVLQRIIVVISIIFIVIGALMYMTSMGDTAQIGKGKNAITAAIVGLAIALAAPSFLKEVLLIIGQDPGQVGGSLSLSQIALRVLNFLLSISGVIAMIMMVVGAIMYLTAAGDTKDIDKGKAIFKWSVIGVIVALSALIIVRQVAALLAA